MNRFQKVLIAGMVGCACTSLWAFAAGWGFLILAIKAALLEIKDFCTAQPFWGQREQPK